MARRNFVSKGLCVVCFILFVSYRGFVNGDDGITNVKDLSDKGNTTDAVESSAETDNSNTDQQDDDDAEEDKARRQLSDEVEDGNVTASDADGKKAEDADDAKEDQRGSDTENGNENGKGNVDGGNREISEEKLERFNDTEPEIAFQNGETRESFLGVPGLIPNLCYHSQNQGRRGCGGQQGRLYFNLGTRQCHTFIYFGCGGNRNNFRTVFECRCTCLGQCSPGGGGGGGGSPVGNWNLWGPWGRCSVSCGIGTAIRRRTCFGQICDGLNTEIRQCNLNNNCGFSNWGGWGVCSGGCGQFGFQTRTRSCTWPVCLDPVVSETRSCFGACNQGVVGVWSPWSACPAGCNMNSWHRRSRNCLSGWCSQPMSESKVCRGSCIRGIWTEWTTARACSVSCGQGVVVRHRQCISGTCMGAPQATTPCFRPQCSVWSNWGFWAVCSATCGQGEQTRLRECRIPPCPGLPFDSRPCGRLRPCLNAEWGNWLDWGPCNVPCDGGIRIRQRVCSQFGQCSGSALDTQQCNAHSCSGEEPSTQLWGEWSDWSTCSVSCDGGLQRRQRTCQQNGQCQTGVDEESQTCNVQPCQDPVDDGLWSRWSECSVTCAQGIQQRSHQRQCRPSEESCDGPNSETIPCDEGVCEGLWGNWTDWTPCSVSCGPGMSERERNCDRPMCLGPSRESRSCTGTCVEGVWDDWTTWSCSVTCGVGQEMRMRSCTDDGHCQGTNLQRRRCDRISCDDVVAVDQWEQWSEWNECSVTCGDGEQIRTRECSGQNCEGNSDETRRCDLPECDEESEWEEWSEWDECTLQCDGGEQTRTRECRGQGCDGAVIQTRLCNDHDCQEESAWQSWGAWSSCSVTCGAGVTTRGRECDGDSCEGRNSEENTCDTQHCPVAPGCSRTRADLTLVLDSSRSMRDANPADGSHDNWNRMLNVLVNIAQRLPVAEEDFHIACVRFSDNSGTVFYLDDHLNNSSSLVEAIRDITYEGQSRNTALGLFDMRTSAFIPPNENPSDRKGDRLEAPNIALLITDGPSDLNQQNTLRYANDSKTDGITLVALGVGVGVDDTELMAISSTGIVGETVWKAGDYMVSNSLIEEIANQICALSEEASEEEDVWGDWQEWGSCTESCDEGVERRVRVCTGESCPGDDTEARPCNRQPCGIWTPWAEWSFCTRTCGGGETTRSRTCASGNCAGVTDESSNCNTHIICPAENLSSWGGWSEWLECTETCGGGTKTRHRSCRGSNCTGWDSETEPCNTQSCTGSWSDWGPWSDCSATCGPGFRSRDRTCSEEDCDGLSNQRSGCNVTPCTTAATESEDGWDNWQEWLPCSETCGEGWSSRYRGCSRLELGCVGRRVVTKQCSDKPCWGAWQPWLAWSECSASCGAGRQHRSRTCRGGQCNGTGIESQHCETECTNGEPSVQENSEEIPPELKLKLEQRFPKNIIDKIAEFRRGWQVVQLTDDTRSARGRSMRRRNFNPSQKMMNWWRSIPTKAGARGAKRRRRKRQAPGEIKTRREYRTLTREERVRFHNVLLKMKRTMIDDTSQYDIFIQFHQPEWSPGAHFGAAFLPWHREFIFRFELVMQTHDPSVFLPYWDSTLDSGLPEPHDSILFSDQFMGNGEGIVNTGVPRLWSVFNRCRLEGQNTLIRGGNENTDQALFIEADINYVMNQRNFEGVLNPPVFEWEHGGTHIYVGGHMTNITCSPFDPLFFMHHAFVDLVWESFRNQKQNQTERESEFPYNSTSQLGGPLHHPYTKMSPFEPLENIHGLQTFYTDFFYNYAPRPLQCGNIVDRSCGLNLFCHEGRCKSKVMRNGICSGLPEGRPEVCECGICLRGRCRETQSNRCTAPP